MMQCNAAEKCPPGKERVGILCHRAEADAKSSSCLSRQPRPDQTRRRSWTQRAQDSSSQTGKPIRLNRVPLLRAETSSPRTTTQEVPGLSEGVVLVSSGSSGCGSSGGSGSSGGGSGISGSLPCQKRALKRGYPQEAAEPQIPESPLAKRRRLDDVPDQKAKASGSSTARQVASRMSQDSQSSRRQTASYRPPWIFPHSHPGPIRMRHVWWEQQREKKPYSRPQNQSRTRGAVVPGVHSPHPSK